MAAPVQHPTSLPAQDFVPIKEVRDGIIVLKDGGMRAILLASSINFALKSAEEQQAILFQFQGFLNSLDFSAQIFVQSRKLDIRPYIATLEERSKAETGDLLKIQIREYIQFVKTFTESANIMTKSFFVVVPFAPFALENAGKSSLIPEFLRPKKGKKEATEEKAEEFEEHRGQLEQRVSVVEQGLVRCGVRIVQLGTEEVIELFYKLFNPGDTEKPVHIS